MQRFIFLLAFCGLYCESSLADEIVFEDLAAHLEETLAQHGVTSVEIRRYSVSPTLYHVVTISYGDERSASTFVIYDMDGLDRARIKIVRKAHDLHRSVSFSCPRAFQG